MSELIQCAQHSKQGVFVHHFRFSDSDSQNATVLLFVFNLFTESPFLQLSF
jgi:hypothetical protein